MRFRSNSLIAAFCLVLSLPASRLAADDFALRDGDTVVFLGDSITAARTYGKIIENYTLLRFPERKVRFINAGQGGDTATGGLARLERDVFNRQATVLTVAYGVNDIGWGLRADAEHKQKYLDAIRGIVSKCRESNVRVFICSAAITAADPFKSENDFLQTMCDEGLEISRSLGGGAIDVQRTMRNINQTIWKANEGVTESAKKTTMHAADGVHLNELGQLAMAFAILKGLGAPADVSAAAIDVDSPQSVQETGCRISHVKYADGTVEFDRLDDGLPINFGLFGALNFRFVPIPEQLNRYLLTVKNLPAGKYDVLADDRRLGSYPAAQLARGVNISFATADPWQPGGPWDVQATLLKHLTDARNDITLSQALGAAYKNPAVLDPAVVSQSSDLNERLERLQRDVAHPRPYHFVVRPTAETAAQE
jgi:lysophospholipase L1-like esterase